MLRTLKILGAFIAFAGLSAQSSPSRYAEGQVWNYKTRSGDEGSLLKIQRIEHGDAEAKIGPIYHISVVGFRLRNATIVPMLPHAPVSRETLDTSVTTLSSNNRNFPPADPGIEEWRQAQGGVFTISIAEIIEILDQQMASAASQQSQ